MINSKVDEGIPQPRNFFIKNPVNKNFPASKIQGYVMAKELVRIK